MRCCLSTFLRISIKLFRISRKDLGFKDVVSWGFGSISVAITILAKSEATELKEETDQMVKAKGQICSKILEKHRKIASLVADMSTLNQTLELIQQERVSLSAKISEKSAYYNTVAATMTAKLCDQQVWVNSHKFTKITGEHGLVKDKIEQQTGESIKSMAITDNQTGEAKNLVAKLDYNLAKLNEIMQMKSQLLEETTKMKQSLKQVKHRLSAYKPEVRALDMKTLEEEQEALLSDKTGETEYLQSLNIQSQKLKIREGKITHHC
ncbi:hypothetical protein RJ641_031458 [Dillenia turbinata]|uniref:Uncharacterized protein n=1 Tax=Dillenia turbinata TaxID=194707 RepID=A0AAN8ZKZ2_9MAGN